MYDNISMQSDVALATAMILALLLFSLFAKQSPHNLKFRIKPLMTECKREFYGRLLTALPEYHIYPQVGFRAIIQPNSGRCSRSYRREMSAIKETHCDFIICDKDTLVVIALISLDDHKDTNQKNFPIEIMLASTGYQMLRFLADNKPSIREIKAAFYGLPGLREKDSLQILGADVLHLQSKFT